MSPNLSERVALIEAQLLTLAKGQDLVLAKIDGFTLLVNQLAGDADKSPAGRALLSDVQRLDRVEKEHATQLRDLTAWANEVRGVVGFLKWVGVGNIVGIIVALMAMAKAFRLIG